MKTRILFEPEATEPTIADAVDAALANTGGSTTGPGHTTAPADMASTATEAQAKAVSLPAFSSRPAQIGRGVHVYSPKKWVGAMPGTVVAVHADSGRVNVNVEIDGVRYPHILQACRHSNEGTTAAACALFDELTPAQRETIAEFIWAEWPPLVK